MGDGGLNEIHLEVLGRKKKCISVCIRKEITEGGRERETETDTGIKRDINRYVQDWQYKSHLSKCVYLSTG